ncbi:aryl-sulfate sulfotransferase, partial [Salmonella enterica]|uniref:aryl-sulfate sulfotransferase n=1 Tax=Salmonella enterica TaxID=28901 RepID=UPI00398C3FD3
YSNGRPDGYATGKDGVSIINLSTGLEVAEYEMLSVMDCARLQRPAGIEPGNDVAMVYWLHCNQSHINEPNNLLILSARHESALFCVNVVSGEFLFCCANHYHCFHDFTFYLSTPVDDVVFHLYCLTCPRLCAAAS